MAEICQKQVVLPFQQPVFDWSHFIHLWLLADSTLISPPQITTMNLLQPAEIPLQEATCKYVLEQLRLQLSQDLAGDPKYI